MKTKKAGILTKIVLLAVLIYAAITLLTLRAQIQSAETEKTQLAKQIETQTESNAALSEDIKDSSDPQKISDIARQKLGLMAPGEKVFYDISN